MAVDLPRTDGIVVAPMRSRHLRGVVELERSTNPRPWSERLFRDELRMGPSRHYVVAQQDHLVVGFGGIMFNPDEAHVTTVAVAEPFQRQGVASRLLLVGIRCVIDRGVDAVTLEVRITNRAAQALYRRFGFAPGGIRRAYYRDNREDALVMWAHDLDTAEYAERLDSIEAALPSPLVIAGTGPQGGAT
ncbi:MAG: ribosomal-protein-alanine N-acetyltransferase [Actinobacteria bacterium]|nr:ribosomal-protein-alanine N-acetyltransferase [Actinomycetota bacterium]